MNFRSFRRLIALVALGSALALMGGCNDPDEDLAPLGDLADPNDSEASLTDYDALFMDAPDNSTLPEEGKTDQVFPGKFDVRDTQSPMKSQGGRGVCSIFSTTALMEHLYIKEGTLAEPDFSEQYLQWSAKIEVGRFKNTSGSNASTNLEAINRFGIVTEDAYPYVSSAWGTSQDEACTGDERPVQCYTQGDPPQSAVDAKKWKLPRGRFIRTSDRSIKAYMQDKGTGVVAGMTFFYQSWNHRASKLKVNSAYWSEGYVMYPNADDKEKSLEKRAGHSILLIGWDDDLEVAKVDGEGNVITDDKGDPVMEKGFWLFKNSWGTGGFGVRNEFGEGYGWLSYEYVREFATIYSADVPTVELEAEVCDDDKDNNLDALSDCDDPQCASHPACSSGGLNFANSTPTSITDNDPAGITSTINVTQPGSVGKVTVSVDIAHTFRGDLVVTLTSPDGTSAVLHDKKGGGEDNLIQSFNPDAFTGRAIEGEWTLTVSDNAKEDTGTLNGWSLEFELGGDLPAENCGDGIDNDGNGDTDCGDIACAAFEGCMGATTLNFENTTTTPIPDNDPNGVKSQINVSELGEISSMTVTVDISHTFRGDLTVKLIHDETGTEVVLHNKTGGNADNLFEVYAPSEFLGEAVTGTWSLVVSDAAEQDTGMINAWMVEFAVIQ